MSTKLKSRLINIILALATFALLFLFLEAALRVNAYFDDKKIFSEAFTRPIPVPKMETASLIHLIYPSGNDRLIYELKPNVQCIYASSLVTINKEGLRDLNYKVDKPSGTVRIVGIGDSIMFGQGVWDGKEYMTVLENSLNLKHPQGKWQTINAGVVGYNTVMEVEALKTKGLKYRPDLVIVNFCSNDMQLPNFLRTKEDYFTLRKSFAADFVTRRAAALGNKKGGEIIPSSIVANYKGSVDEDAMTRAVNIHNSRERWALSASPLGIDDPSKVPPQYRDMVGWDAYEKAMMELKRLSVENGFDVIVLLFERVSGGDIGPFAKRAVGLSEDLGFHVVDVLPALRKYMAENGIQVWEGSALCAKNGDLHPSETAHRMATEEVIAYMEKSGLIAKYVGK